MFKFTFLVGDVIEYLVDFCRFSNGHFDWMAIVKCIGDHTCSEVIREKLCPDIVLWIHVIDS